MKNLINNINENTKIIIKNEDYEADENIISLGILPEKQNIRADVYADIINIEDIKLK